MLGYGDSLFRDYSQPIKRVVEKDSISLYDMQKTEVDSGDFVSASRTTLYLNNPDYYMPQAFYSEAHNYNKTDGSIVNEGDPTSNKYDKEDFNIRAEKDRIESQRAEFSSNRQDSFGIGTVFFRIPPTQIIITNEANHFRYGSLRQAGETVLTTGRSNTRIDLEIIFSGLEDINNKLRPLIAQFKSTPFLPIYNEHITRVLNPFDKSVEEAKYVDSLESQKDDLNVKKTAVDSLLELSSKTDVKISEIQDKITYLWDNGLLGDKDDDYDRSFFQKILFNTRDYLVNPESIPTNERNSDHYTEDQQGNKYFSMKKFIYSHISAKGNSMYIGEKTLNDIGSLEETIQSIKSEQAAISSTINEEKLKRRQVVGVLSQISVSTAPGFPDSLVCRLSMYTFNYEAFSIDFSYIAGYDKNRFTTDITKCSMFVDWYTRRWLCDRNNAIEPSLSRYAPGESAYISFPRDINLSRSLETSPRTFKIGMESIDGDGLILTGMGVSIRNIIQFLPILSHKSPTCQYMGSMNADVTITFDCINKDKLKELCRVVETIGEVSRKNNRTSRNAFIYVYHPILELFGMKYFKIGNFSVDTVVGSPGLFSITLGLIEHKIGQEDIQTIKREYVTSNEDIVAAARWIIERAHDYKVNGIEKYVTYFNQVADKNFGWLSNESGLIRRFVNNKQNSGLFSENRNQDNPIPEAGMNVWTDKELRAIIERRAENLGFGDYVNGTAKSVLELSQSNGVLAFGVGKFLDLSTGNVGFSNKDIDGYQERFVESLINDSGPDSFYKNNLEAVSRVVSIMRRGDIIERIMNRNNKDSELSDYLGLNKDAYGFEKEKDKINMAKRYCYPDLSLPNYSDIPNGSLLINTRKEYGLSSSSGYENELAQSSSSKVDPDFFMYKSSIWDTIDGKALGYVDDAITTYKKMAYGELQYRVGEQVLDEEQAALMMSSKSVLEADKQSGLVLGTDISYKDALEGKVLDVVDVEDGDTITVSDGSTTYSVRLIGFDTQETKQVEKSLHPDIEKANQAKDKLNNLLGKRRKVKLYFSRSDMDSTGKRLLATVKYQKDDGSWAEKSANDEMIDDSVNLKISLFSGSDDYLRKNRELAFWKNHEAFIKSKSSDKMQLVYHIAGDTVGNFAAYGGVGAVIKTIPFFGSLSNLINISFGYQGDGERKTLKDDIVDYTAIAASNLLGAIAPTNYHYAKVFAGDLLTNDIGGDISKAFTEKTDNSGNKRFDRSSDLHIELVAKKIREQQKSDIFRMARAYPTFKIYFIEEDAEEWQRFDDFYSYQAVQSIDVTKSRKEAADVAVIKFINTTGVLDTSYFGLHSDMNDYFTRKNLESIKRNDQETDREQDIERFILQPGTTIKILMGYSSDPDLLETVFIGPISDVSGGDIIEVVAQGFGIELLKPVPRGKYLTESASAFKVLDRIITSAETLHFGKVEWFRAEQLTDKKVFRRLVYSNDRDNPLKLIGPSIWRNIGGVKFFLSIREDTRDNNIWVPENSWVYNMWRGGYSHFVTKNMTIWDAFRDMMKRFPGYITTVLPFDNRSTIYFGPADFMYWYTSRNKTELLDRRIKYDKNLRATSQEKIDDLLTSYDFSQNDFNYIDDCLLKASKSLSDIYSNHQSMKPDIDRLIKTISMGEDLDGEAISGAWTPEKGLAKSSYTFLETKAQSFLLDSSNDVRSRQGMKFISSAIRNGRVDGIISASRTADSISISRVKSDLPLYVDKKSGEIYDELSVVKHYDNRMKTDYEEKDPSRKLLRNYHFKDSFHHIISNGIVANSSYMSNRVTVEYGSSRMWKKGESSRKPINFHRMSVTIDDDIWPERIKEKIVQEKNADNIISAWMYALGNLWEEARNMYSGFLTITGDPSVKPYDYIMMNDYFTDMHGPIEVEQVVHHFSHDTGFVTTVVPDLVCHINNVLQGGSLVVAGALMNPLAEQILKIRSLTYIAAIPGIVGFNGVFPRIDMDAPYKFAEGASRIAFWISGLGKEFREPISFTPLWYSGRPFIAGVEGMRKNSLCEAITGKIYASSLRWRRNWEGAAEAFGNLTTAYRGIPK